MNTDDRAGVNDRGPDTLDPHHAPTLRAFVLGRIASVNGLVAGLYLLLSLWVYYNPRRARAIWRLLSRSS